MERLRVGILGAGYWGPNLVRTFASLPACEVAYVCDQRPGRLQYIAEQFPDVTLTQQYQDLLNDERLDAVAIVTPPPTHRRLAAAALRAGKHVFVEKPLAHTVDDAQALVEMADAAGRVLATGHIFVYHPAITKLRETIEAGNLGRLCYAASDRVNLGSPTAEVDVIWDLAVHDVSIVLALVGREPEEVLAEGRQFVHPSLLDAAFLTLRFSEGVLAHIHVSWLSPLKVRRFSLSGTLGTGTFDDTREADKLMLTGRGEDSRIGARDSEAKELVYRPGEVITPTLSTTPPLTIECAHFLDCIRSGSNPIADGRAGLAVVRILDAAERSVAINGRPVQLTTMSPGGGT